MSPTKITSIKFTNFKSLRNYTVSLHDTNILVGPNNAGKSTIISSLRILEVALRKAKSRNPERIHLPDGSLAFGHHIPTSQLSVSLENVATDYNEEDSRIDFRLSNKNKLTLHFPNEGGCILCWETEDSIASTVSKFRTAFPISVQVVPVLGPLEHKEGIVNRETVQDALNTHRASRHFRNYWHYFPDGWDDFAYLIESTWPGISIQRPEINNQSKQLAMFISENRITREVYWAGFGFQVWCQLLTHISRANDSTLFAIDEPEIYLHPDIQRRLLGIVRKLQTDVVLATHSIEIIGEADPGEILLVQKGKSSALRLRDVEDMQLALSAIGSAQNITMTHLARTKKIVFTEGYDDFKTVRRFAKVLGYEDLSTGNDLTPFESGGFSSWEKIKYFASGFKQTLNKDLKIFSLYDRDYFCDEEIKFIENDLRKELTDAFILTRKEMENYFLNTEVLQRALDKQLEQKNKRQGTNVIASKRIEEYLLDITADEKIDAQSQYIAKKLEYLKSKKPHLDSSTISKETLRDFEIKWLNVQTRLSIVPGKTILRALRDAIQKDLGVSLTDIQIIDEHKKDEIPKDMVELISRLENFRNL